MFFTVDREGQRHFVEKLICASVADHSTSSGLTSLTYAAVQTSSSYMKAIEV
jgi:hypothetical protein